MSVAVAASLVIATSGALACNLNGDFIVAFQSNNTVATFNHIAQNGEEIDGLAKFNHVRGDFRGVLEASGRFNVTVDWDDGSHGVYTAFITEDGRVFDGRTYDRNNKANFATWGIGAEVNRLQCS
ncbi:MAG: hypothetical protein ABI216_08775 [Devosia sp.]